MATDVDVQYFSHLNGLTLSNNWGDLIRLLDKALVTGIDFTQITAASIDEQGDVHITLYSAHNAMLFQVVEMTGFTPQSLNQRYRIKGIPNTTQLILKPKTEIVERAITTKGSGKLASLGYEIIFRDTNDVKRVYRAKNPTVQHPYIRVDESITSPDGVTGVYNSNYAKSAMVGLLEHMDHIDDYENPNVLQLPFNPAGPAKNWKITGTGASVVKGWSKWVWYGVGGESGITSGTTKQGFTLAGDQDAFYLLMSENIYESNNHKKHLHGCGLFNSSLKSDVVPNWFLMTLLDDRAASSVGVTDTTRDYANPVHGAAPLINNLAVGGFFVPKYNEVNPLVQQVTARAIMQNDQSGRTTVFGTTLGALSYPFYDADSRLRGVLRHVAFCGNNNASYKATTPMLAGVSMYVYDSAIHNSYHDIWGGFYFYLGSL